MHIQTVSPSHNAKQHDLSSESSEPSPIGEQNTTRQPHTLILSSGIERGEAHDNATTEAANTASHDKRDSIVYMLQGMWKALVDGNVRESWAAEGGTECPNDGAATWLF